MRRTPLQVSDTGAGVAMRTTMQTIFWRVDFVAVKQISNEVFHDVAPPCGKYRSSFTRSDDLLPLRNGPLSDALFPAWGALICHLDPGIPYCQAVVTGE